MKTKTNKYWAVEQTGYAIFGVGTSKSAAIEEARRWVDEPANLDTIGEDPNVAHGELRLIEISDTLYRRLQNGGDPTRYDQTDGRLDIEELA